jgi:hypothetical protein
MPLNDLGKRQVADPVVGDQLHKHVSVRLSRPIPQFLPEGLIAILW